MSSFTDGNGSLEDVRRASTVLGPRGLRGRGQTVLGAKAWSGGRMLALILRAFLSLEPLLAIPQVLTHRRALKFEILPQIYLKLT